MSQSIRTRFAPSPTGFLHVGGLRTALYNFIFARHHNGQMVLRIEDTDRTRLVEGATENLIQTLHMMGIDYQEGPDKGGPHAPYVQSRRTEKYQKHARQLIDKGDAYYCFCSLERLEMVREEQEGSGIQSGYDGHCRELPDAEIKKQISAKLPFVIRLKMPRTGETRFTDLIRGEVSVQNEMTDDQILIKSDGQPTYHLANVVDDHDMQISHVIRGEEWLLSVPKHLRLYQAFGWQPPHMAHLPLLLNADRSKLSKRQGDVAVEDFLEKGYLPSALNNYIALLGWNPGTDQEIFSLDQLIQLFSLERVNKSGAVFDIQKLNWMNSQYIKNLNAEERLQFLLPFLNKSGYPTSDPKKNRQVIDAVYQRLSFGEEASREAAIFYTDTLEISEPAAIELLEQPSSRQVLNEFLIKSAEIPELNLENFKILMKEVQQDTGIKKEALWMPIRVALTGITHGPELPVVVEIFGKNKIRSFIQQALNLRK